MEYKKVEGKDKGTIVFIHGNSSSSNVFNGVMESTLISQTKIAVDLPGHGSSVNGYVDDEDFSMKSYCKLLTKLIASIDDDILLVGNSLGGHIAIEVANNVNRLKGVVIYGTPPLKKPLNLEEAYLPVPELQTMFTEYPTDEDIQAVANVALYNKGKAIDVYEDFKKSNSKVRKAISEDAANGLLADEYAIFTQLKAPRFIIAGDQDPSVNLNYLKEVKEACNGSCELTMIENCGHYPSLDQLKEFIDVLKKITNKVFD